MLRQRSALAISKFVQAAFVGFGKYGYAIRQEGLHDFLFVREYPAWFVSSVQGARLPEELKSVVLGLFDGSTAGRCMLPSQHALDARAIGQDALLEFAADMLSAKEVFPSGRPLGQERQNLLRSLELDGYTLRGNKLVPTESEANEVEEEQGEVASLYSRLALGDATVVLKHLRDSEQRYMDGAWGDCISNARNYMEEVLKQIALAIASLPGRSALKEPDKAVAVRRYLAAAGVLSEKEVTFVAALYGLLSDSGSHANMSEQDHARIFRSLALDAAHFALLRYQAVR